MQFLKPGEKPPVGVVFDCDMAQIDDALALALLYGLDGKREARVASLSISRPSLQAAAFCDVVARFYAGPASPFMRMLPVGMEVKGKVVAPEAALKTALTKPDYKPGIQELNDTAEAAALIRNAFTAHHDGNCLAVVAGPATNMVKALSVVGTKEFAAQKVRFLTLVPDASDVDNTRKLLAEWPGQVVVVNPEIGERILYPGSSITTDFAWSQAHPVVDAYKAFGTMPYDAPTAAMAAVLYAIRPKENYFKLSEPGTMTVLDDGRLKLTPSAQGKHRELLFDAEQKDRVIKTYTEIASAKPVPRVPRFRQMPEEKKEEPPKVPEAKP